MRVSILEAVGRNCVTLEDGERVRLLIAKPLQDGQDVVLDFEGVLVIASPFLNSALGQLLAEFPEPRLRAHLSLVNLNPAGAATASRVIENAKAFYARNAEQQQKLSRAVAAHAD
jgi:hypothetical protein